MNVSLVPVLEIVGDGFTSPLSPLPGTSFYTPDSLTDHDLALLIGKKAETNEGHEYCVLFGGYLLCIDGAACYYPQCCSDLAENWLCWNCFAKGELSCYPGHPAPAVTFDQENIYFDFTEEDEPFSPPVFTKHLTIPRQALQQAIARLKSELDVFGERLEKINLQYSLGFKNITRSVLGSTE